MIHDQDSSAIYFKHHIQHLVYCMSTYGQKQTDFGVIRRSRKFLNVGGWL